jgi:two-component system cell cycle sensor histidine kinase/response regulator CckA
MENTPSSFVFSRLHRVDYATRSVKELEKLPKIKYTLCVVRLTRLHRKEFRDVIIVSVITIFFPLFSMSIHLNERLYAYFRENNCLFVAEYLVNFIFLYLIGLLFLTYRRWKKAEASKRELDDIVSSINPDVLLVVDEEQKIILCNPSVQRMFGYTADEVQGQKTENLFLDGIPASSEYSVAERLEKEGHHISLGTGRKKSGETLPLEIVTAYLGGRKGSVILLRDISERKNLEEELLRAKTLESVGILAGGIAHDFNNILMAMTGQISLAKRLVQREDKVYERLSSAETASVRAKDLAQQLLTFSKGGEPVKRIVHIADTLKASVQFSLMGTKITCSYEIDNDLLPAEVDEEQLRSVIHNLATNAREAMPEGGEIFVTARNVDVEGLEGGRLAPGKYVRTTITDTGSGIRQEDLPRIFTPYFTTKGAGTKKGMGLGLAICHSIVRKHGGHITVSSPPGEGATFDIFLPAAKEGVKRAGESKMKSKGEKLRVLLMDDEEMVRNITAEMLEELGCRVTETTDGREALETYRAHQARGETFDLVILDLTVPKGLGGKEVMPQFLDLDANARVVISSGYADDPVMSRYEDYGFSDVVRKPYNIEELHAVLTRVLEK